MRLRVWTLLLSALLLLGGCGSRPGTANALSVKATANGQTDGEGIYVKTPESEVRIPPGYDAEINTASAKQPTPPDTAATAEVKHARSDTGSAGKSMSQLGLSGTLWMGIGLIIAGALIFLAKRAGVASMIAPGPTGFLMRIAGVVPKGFGVSLMIIGGCVIVLPWFLTSIQPLVIPVASCAVLVLMAWWIWNIVQAEKKEQRAQINIEDLPHDEIETEKID